jgi:hypothetical protein
MWYWWKRTSAEKKPFVWIHYARQEPGNNALDPGPLKKTSEETLDRNRREDVLI